MPIRKHNNYDANQKLKSTSETTVDPDWENRQEIQHVNLDSGNGGAPFVKLKDCDGNDVCTNYPLATNGDTVYVKDVALANSTIGTFAGTISSLFDSIQNEITDTSSTNPKTITLVFVRPITTSQIGIASKTGNFSNVKILLKTVSGDTRQTIDDSANNTKYTSQLYPIEPQTFDTMVVEFHTEDTVKIAGMTIPKLVPVVARIQGISDLTGLTEDIGSFRDALNVNQALVHKVGISEHFRRNLGAATTLDVAASSGDTLINVASTTGFSVGDLLTISDSTVVERSHFHITTVNAGVSLVLNRPIDNSFDVGDTVQEVDIGMNVLGTLASPVSFKIEPPATERWQITRLLITILDQTAMDDAKFGGIGALPNGFVIRTVINGVTRTYTHWKANSDLKDDMYDVSYSTKAPAGFYGLSGRWTFTKAEFISDLDGATGDYLECLNQDDLTGLDDFEIKAQGRLYGG